MGCTLSAPVELVRVQRHGSGAFRCAVAEMQGWRTGHEDAHEMVCGEKSGAFWVLDGHGGDGAANYGAPSLAKEFEELVKSDQLLEDERITKGMVEVDTQLRKHFVENPSESSGSTVIGAMAALSADGSYNLKLINCGDSRAIVVRSVSETEESAKEVSLRVPDHLTKLTEQTDIESEYLPRTCKWPLIQETVDHKPSHPTEKSRIEAAGGHVTTDDPPRLDGNLAVSRGLGDFEYKGSAEKPAEEQKVSCVPDIYEITGLQAGALCILCCDGVWDVLTGQDVGCLVRDKLAEDPGADLGELAAQIVKTSLDKNSRDNVTAMIVQLGAGGEWAATKPPDEMMHFEKLCSEGLLEEDMRKAYLNFLKRCKFPPEPCTCGNCSKWYVDMQQCACKKVMYCSKACQKKQWKKHKLECSAVQKHT